MSESAEKISVEEEPKVPDGEREQGSQNSTSKIWSEISVNKTKEIREIIEIGEQKSNSHPQAQQNSQQQIQKGQNHLEITTNNEVAQGSIQLGNQGQSNSQLKSEPQKQTFEKNNIQQQKEGLEYISMKQLFQNGHLNLDIWKEERQNQRIYAIKKEELFKEIPDQNKIELDQTQLKVLDYLINKYSHNKSELNQQNQFNFIRLIDLLYKKYIVSPLKMQQKEQNQTKNLQYEIYKPDIVFCERKYQILDKLPSHLEPHNFKRNESGKTYHDNFVSLVDNESTNQNQDYLGSIANNFVNGIRRQKFPDSPTDSQFSKPPISQPLDKFKKYGNPNPEISLPFDIDIYDNGSKKQLQNQYNLFQSSDDDKSERFKTQRMVAKTFIKDGYGLQIIRNYMGPSMDGGTYNRAITTIIRESYKKIQDFLTKTCNMKIHCLTSQEFSLVKTPLVHCRNILKSQDLNTFFKYIGITYNIWKLKKQEYPTAQETFSLYSSILRGLSDRKTAKDHMPRPSRQRDLYYR